MIWFAGLDLGKIRDPSAFAVIEETRSRRPCVTLLKTWRPERDDCVDTLSEVVRLVERDRPEDVLLGIDARGIGEKVARVALRGETSRLCQVFPLLPSSSDERHRQRPEDGYIVVWKRALFRAVIDAVEDGTLLLARGLEESEAFIHELKGLRAIPTKGGSTWTYSHGNQKKGSHDDRISAVANGLFLYRYGRAGTPTRERVRPANKTGGVLSER